jgi:O-methyltransferase
MNLYPTPISKIKRRIQDVPWSLANAYEGVFPSRFSHSLHQVRSHSMASQARLRGLYQAVNFVIDHKICGDVVECGTARGGSAAMLGLALNDRQDQERKLWVFDTFEGLPAPTLDDPDYEQAKFYTGDCYGALDEVKALFQQCNLLHRSQFVKGLFQETVPIANISAISVLHLDGDWYDSVKVCLDHFYDLVTPGGIIQIDDYGHWAGARKAVDEFLRQRAIDPRLRYLDYTGRQIIKPFQ